MMAKAKRAAGVQYMHPRWSLVLSLSFSLVSLGFAGDWPQFLGPTRNGVYSDKECKLGWTAPGPRVVWEKEVGHGFSGPVVSGHHLILFQRIGDKETVECLDSASGKVGWSFDYPTTYVDDFGFDDGPRATPAVAEGKVYTLGAEGMLQCLDLSSGKQLWKVDTKLEFQAPKGFFGMACSPLIEGKAVLVNLGGPNGAGVVAFERNSGKVIWKASNDPASYSSPVAGTLEGRQCALFLTGSGLLALEPTAGTVLFQYPWRSRNFASVNSATPLILGDTIFLSASYGTGAVLLRVKESGLEKIWMSNDVLSNHYATSLAQEGFLYGIHGRTDPGFRPGAELRCVELKTGKLQWREESVGAASLILVGDSLLILTEKGELICAAATPQGFQPKARAQVLSAEVRAFPALANGLLYARNKTKLVSMNLAERQ